jgi:hypothetical protein
VKGGPSRLSFAPPFVTVTVRESGLSVASEATFFAWRSVAGPRYFRRKLVLPGQFLLCRNVDLKRSELLVRNQIMSSTLDPPVCGA